MSKVIFASHGGLSKGMKDSVSMIVGPLAEDVQTFSLLPGQNPDDFYVELKQRVENSDESYMILCDIKGGSVHTALSKLAVYPNVTVFSGLNMGLALDAVMKSQMDTLDDSSFQQMVLDSQAGITVMTGLDEAEDEEF